MKRKKGLRIAVPVLIALCLVYVGMEWYLAGADKKKEQQAEAETEYMTDFTSVTGIAFDSGGEELSFTKSEDTWSYDGDLEFPVLQSKVNSIAETAGKIAAVRKLEGGDSLSAYGLDEPVRRIRISSEDGTKKTVLLGNTTEDGNYYAVIEGEETPWLIGSALFTETSCSLDDLMALEEFPDVEGTDITAITVTKDGKSSHYEKKVVDEAEGSIAWYRDSAESEENKLADNSALNVLADSLSSLVVKSCVNYKVTDEELAGYGLSDPQIVITYDYEKNGNKETFTLSVGGVDEEHSGYYTRTEGSKNVNVIDKAEIDKCMNVEQ